MEIEDEIADYFDRRKDQILQGLERTQSVCAWIYLVAECECEPLKRGAQRTGVNCNMWWWVKGLCAVAKPHNMEANCSPSITPRPCIRIHEM